MATRRMLYGLSVLGCLIFYVAYQMWFSWILLLAILLFPWLSLVLSLRAMIRLKLEPAAAKRISQGDAAIIRLITSCPGPRPPYKSKIRIGKANTNERWILRSGDALPTDHCGGLTAQPHRAKVYDYLGLFSGRVRKTAPALFLVMPQPVKMRIPPDLTRFLAQSWRPKSGGGNAENHEIRPYHPGDNLNQVHWKLSAKLDDLVLREPMEPEQGLILLTMDVCGTPSELDNKFGRLLWLGNWFLAQEISYEVRALTGNGTVSWIIRQEPDLQNCIESLICAPAVMDGSIRNRNYIAAWQLYIGGEPGEE